LSRKLKLKNIIIGMCFFIITGLFISILTWYRITDPLANYGISDFNYQDGKQKEYVIELSNEGYGKIDILSVNINGDDKPDKVQLGVTYDSGHMVQVLSFPVPAIVFMDLKASSIFPELTEEEFNAAMEKKVHTPMEYGLRIRYEKKSIQSVTIKYKYLGFTKVKKITRWFNDE
jgi:hypothetical protein